MHNSELMKRPLLALVIALGTLLPAVVVAAFVFGCCVLPFHQALHRVMPLCHVAADVLRGTESESSQPLLPAQATERATRISPSLVPDLFPSASLPGAVLTAPASSGALRSYITLGALRCDDDIGLVLLLNTFRI